MVTHRVASLHDPRLTGLRRAGGGEGFAIYVAAFENPAAVVVDCSTMNEFVDDDDLVNEPVNVMVFTTEHERTAYLTKLSIANGDG